MCPCRKEQADFDKGGFLPDFHCYKNIDKMCDGIENKDAFHCVNSAVSKYHTGQQQCCYYESGDLILTYDQTSGSKPFRAHSMGYFPYNEVFKVKFKQVKNLRSFSVGSLDLVAATEVRCSRQHNKITVKF